MQAGKCRGGITVMSFVDFNFYPVVLILLLLLLFLQAILKKRSSLHNTLKKAILLVFSLWVAGLYDIRFSICLAAVSVITYVSALIIGNAQDGKRGMVTGISVGILIAVLCYFKYVNFLMDSVFAAVGKNWNALSIILPIGISFYIFSAVSYVLDVNWGYSGRQKFSGCGAVSVIFPENCLRSGGPCGRFPAPA